MAKEKAPAEAETKPAANTIPANPAAIVWPQDRYGLTTLLKKEGLRAAGRVKGDPSKLDEYLAVLRVLAGHAKARCEADREAAQKAQARSVAAAKRQRLQEAQRAERTAAELRQAAQNAEAQAKLAEARAAELND